MTRLRWTAVLGPLACFALAACAVGTGPEERCGAGPWPSTSGLVLDDCGTITVGGEPSAGKGGMLAQVDARGRRLFEQQLDFEVLDLAATEAGDFVVVGLRDPGGPEAHGIAARVDGRGVLWTTELASRSADAVAGGLSARHVVADADGIYVAGFESRTTSLDRSAFAADVRERPFLSRLDLNGNLLWQETFGDSGVYTNGLALGDGGGAVLALRLNGANVDLAGEHFEGREAATLLVGVSMDGRAISAREVGQEHDETTRLSRGPSGTLYSAGTRPRADLPFTANGVFVAASGPDGTVRFRASIDHGVDLELPSVAERPDGSAVVASRYRDAGGAGTLLVHLDSQGRELGRRVLSGASITQLAAPNAGGLVLLGSGFDAVPLESTPVPICNELGLTRLPD